MKVTKHNLALLLALLVMSVCASANPLRSAGSQIEITEIKNMGVSAARETNSIIQVKWTTQNVAEVKIVSFDVQLEVSYADGFSQAFTAKAGGGARNSRFEVPTLHRAGSQPASELTGFKVSITANYSETTSKQGVF